MLYVENGTAVMKLMVYASHPFFIGGKRKAGWKTVKVTDANAIIL